MIYSDPKKLATAIATSLVEVDSNNTDVVSNTISRLLEAGVAPVNETHPFLKSSGLSIIAALKASRLLVPSDLFTTIDDLTKSFQAKYLVSMNWRETIKTRDLSLEELEVVAAVDTPSIKQTKWQDLLSNQQIPEEVLLRWLEEYSSDKTSLPLRVSSVLQWGVSSPEGFEKLKKFHTLHEADEETMLAWISHCKPYNLTLFSFLNNPGLVFSAGITGTIEECEAYAKENYDHDKAQRIIMELTHLAIEAPKQAALWTLH